MRGRLTDRRADKRYCNNSVKYSKSSPPGPNASTPLHLAEIVFSSHQMRRLSQRANLPLAALFILSLLEGSTVLSHDLFPGIATAALPPLQHSAMALGCFALAAAITTAILRRPLPSISELKLAAATGLTLFAIPASLSAVAARSIPPLTVAALETLAPLFCVILDPYLASVTNSAQQESHPRFGILPPLIAFSGVLLIFPVFVPSSYAAALGFAAALLAALSLGAGNCLAVRVASSTRSLTFTAATASISAACILGLLSAFLEEPRLHASMLNTPTVLLFLIELIALTLLFWLTRRISAPRLATRVVWTLLLPILIEAAALPVPLTTRSWIGLTLMAFGSGVLLFFNNRTPESGRFLSQ